MVALVREARELLHALKNPLYGISAATEVLMGGEWEPETAEALAQMKEAATQAERHAGALGDTLVVLAARAHRQDA